jgi:hypothetical protein
MRLVLEIQTGSVAPRSVAIEPGTVMGVGRALAAQVVLSDRTVSRKHFAIAFDGRTGRIRDLGSAHGTIVNGRSVNEAVLYDGDLIQAGMTMLRVRFEDRLEDGRRPVAARPTDRARPVPPATGAVEPTVLELTLHNSVVRELRARKAPLYAILDAARDPLILARLLDCNEEHQSLYDGAEGDKLAAFAPYLVALPRESTLLETIVRDGWGESWGVYLTCDKPFNEVRKHLRRFLMVKLEGEEVYFRFYDPRVLRAFLPTCAPGEIREFFGPIGEFLVEADDPGTVLPFTPHGPGLARTVVVSNGANAQARK